MRQAGEAHARLPRTARLRSGGDGGDGVNPTRGRRAPCQRRRRPTAQRRARWRARRSATTTRAPVRPGARAPPARSAVARSNDGPARRGRGRPHRWRGARRLRLHRAARAPAAVRCRPETMQREIEAPWRAARDSPRGQRAAGRGSLRGRPATRGALRGLRGCGRRRCGARTTLAVAKRRKGGAGGGERATAKKPAHPPGQGPRGPRCGAACYP
jgi:hypothetical protein